MACKSERRRVEGRKPHERHASGATPEKRDACDICCLDTGVVVKWAEVSKKAKRVINPSCVFLEGVSAQSFRQTPLHFKNGVTRERERKNQPNFRRAICFFSCA